MNKIKDFISKNKIAVILVSSVVVIGILAAIIAGCLHKGPKKGGESSALKEAAEASVTIGSRGGLFFRDVNVSIYEDDTLEELVDVQRTDSAGTIVFQTEGRDKYVAVIEGVPSGYDVKDSYEITEVDTVILLDTKLVSSEDLSKEKLVPGDIMKDFTIKTPDGKSYTLSELVGKKDAVILNFWYLTCIPCKEEFPYLQETYEKYKDSIEVLAMNPINTDDTAIAEYAGQLGLKFPVAQCEEAFSAAFGITSYPTTVVIDRYGMISLVKTGSIDGAEAFEAIFQYYKNSGYTQHVVKDLSEIMDQKKPGESESGTTEPASDEEETTESESGESETSESSSSESESEITEPGSETEVEEPEDGKIPYTVTIVDSDGVCVPSVGVKIGASYTSTDQAGEVSIRLEPGSYDVTVTVPDGYQPCTEKYTLTQKKPNLNITITTQKKADYTVTVTDDAGKGVSGVEVFVGSEKAVTNSSGKATFSLVEGSYKATILTPDGYEADSGEKSFDSSRKAAFTIKKGNSGAAVSTTAVYTVTVRDYAGKALSNVGVSFKRNGAVKKTTKTDANGKATAALEKGNYTVELSTDGKYETDAAALSASKTSTEILVASVGKKTQEIWGTQCYEVFEGGTYVPIEKFPGYEYGFVVFHPKRSGTYKVSVSNNGTKLSEHGSVILNFVREGNPLTVNIKDSYLSDNTQYVFGLKGTEGCIVTITRTGNAVLDEGDYPYTTYVGTHHPTSFTYRGSGTLKEFDVSAASGLKISDIVMGTDGFYHYGSASGPVIYLDFKNSKLSLYEMVVGSGNTGGTGFQVYIYDDNGRFDRKEEYTTCLTAYIDCMDPTKHLYPLTEDLRYIMETGGKASGWYDGPNKEMIFGGETILNPKTAWLFLCCY